MDVVQTCVTKPFSYAGTFLSGTYKAWGQTGLPTLGAVADGLYSRIDLARVATYVPLSCSLSQGDFLGSLGTIVATPLKYAAGLTATTLVVLKTVWNGFHPLPANRQEMGKALVKAVILFAVPFILIHGAPVAFNYLASYQRYLGPSMSASHDPLAVFIGRIDVRILVDWVVNSRDEVVGFIGSHFAESSLATSVLRGASLASLSECVRHMGTYSPAYSTRDPISGIGTLLSAVGTWSANGIRRTGMVVSRLVAPTVTLLATALTVVPNMTFFREQTAECQNVYATYTNLVVAMTAVGFGLVLTRLTNSLFSLIGAAGSALSAGSSKSSPPDSGSVSPQNVKRKRLERERFSNESLDDGPVAMRTRGGRLRAAAPLEV